MNDGPRILLWDIETAPFIAALFSPKVRYVPHEAVIQDTYIICICWKWLGEKQVRSLSVLDGGNTDLNSDKYLVTEFHKILQSADILIHQNGDRFDVRRFNARAIIHGLPPLDKHPTSDTLKVARDAFAFDYNRLDYLGKKLVRDEKVKTDFSLWLDCLNGDLKAVKRMVRYCKQDVRLLEEVYLKLRPWARSHPNVGLWYENDNRRCPNCGGERMHSHGWKATRVNRYRRFKCKDCGAYSRAPNTAGGVLR